MAKLYHQEDCDLNLLNGKTIAIIGYGSQVVMLSSVYTKVASLGRELKNRASRFTLLQKLLRRLTSL